MTCVIVQHQPVLTLYSKRYFFFFLPSSNCLFFQLIISRTRHFLLVAHEKERKETKRGKRAAAGSFASPPPDVASVKQWVNAEMRIVQRGTVAAFLGKDQGISEWTGCGSVWLCWSLLRALCATIPPLLSPLLSPSFPALFLCRLSPHHLFPSRDGHIQFLALAWCFRVKSSQKKNTVFSFRENSNTTLCHRDAWA